MDPNFEEITALKGLQKIFTNDFNTKKIICESVSIEH